MAPGIIRALQDEAALETTYARGISLAQAGAVESWSVDTYNGYAEISGTVRGHTDTYQVSVKLDMYVNTVVSHSCNCPAHAKYSGICKHGVALALTYLSSRQTDGAPRINSLASKDATSRKGTSKPAPPVQTSSQITSLVQAYTTQTLRRTEELMAHSSEDAPADPVDLTCIISSAQTAWRYSWAQDSWVLGLKINQGKTSYIVKSVVELVDAWQMGSMLTHGKKLSFVHQHSAFTKRANQLLELISPFVEAQVSLYTAQESRASSSYYYEPVRRVPQKTLPISSTQLVQILDLMQGSQVIVETLSNEYYGSRAKKKRTVRVTDGTPSLAVTLTPAQADSYDLSLKPSSLECISDGKVLYLLGDKEASRCDEAFTRDLGPFCTTVLPFPDSQDALHILSKDMPGFCGAVLPALRQHTNLSAPDNVDAFLPEEPEFSFAIGLEHGFVFCDATVAYESETLRLFEPAFKGQPVRNVEREMAAQQLVACYFNQGDAIIPNYTSPVPDDAYHRKALAPKRWTNSPYEPLSPWFQEDDDDSYYALFTQGLAQLSQLGTVLLSQRLRNVTVRQAPQVRVEANVRSGLLDLHVSSDEMTPAELAAYLASYRLRQKFVRLENGDIVRLDSSIAALGELAEGLGIDESALVEGTQEISANRTLFVDTLLKRATGVRFERNRAFRQIVRDFETVADADFTLPAQLRDVLRPYQAEGFKWLSTLGKVGFGGILADDMGLGKTIQTIAYLQGARDEGETLPALIVCPASLVYNWQAEVERFAPSMDVVTVTGTKRARTICIEAAMDADVLVTSYDLLRRDVDDYEQQHFSCIVLDEAQFVKNHTTKAAKAVRAIDARVRFALTGTPIENRLLELWSIFDFLMPGILGTSDAFSKHFAAPVASGDTTAARRLQTLVSPFILRRLKQDVAQDLPDKNESLVLANMEGEQGKLYRARATKLALTLSDQTPAEFAGQKLKILAELTKLRQLCCDPHLLYENYTGGSAKLETCMELIHQALEGGHSLLLFSQFTSMLEIIEQRLSKEGIGYFKLTGSTSKEARAQLVKRFQAGDVPVFLISLKAGGTGLNLTTADIVIHYDPWWNLAAQDQATDRTHRIGQDKEVSVFKLIAKDTIEEKIVELQEAKRDLAEQVLGGEAVGSSSISRDDLLALLEQGETVTS